MSRQFQNQVAVFNADSSTSTYPWAFSIAEELDHDHVSGGEMSIEDDAPQSLSVSAFKGYDGDQTAGTSAETSNLQVRNAVSICLPLVLNLTLALRRT